MGTEQAVLDIIESQNFHVWVPNVVDIDFSKSLDEESIADVKTAGYKLRGYCSTEGRDRQDEIVVQKGLDFSEFIEHGWFNDNHKQGTVDAIGYPVKAELHDGRGWYTEGFLLRGYAPAEKIVDLAKALSETPRRLGFSIEGKVLERGYDNRIVRAKVRNVAVTNCPVNTECTWELVSKAFASADEIQDHFEKALKKKRGKALAAGYGNPALSGGGALRKESLEKDKVLLTHVRKGMSMQQAVAYYKKIRPDFSDEICERLARYAIRALSNQ